MQVLFARKNLLSARHPIWAMQKSTHLFIIFMGGHFFMTSAFLYCRIWMGASHWTFDFWTIKMGQKKHQLSLSRVTKFRSLNGHGSFRYSAIISYKPIFNTNFGPIWLHGSLGFIPLLSAYLKMISLSEDKLIFSAWKKVKKVYCFFVWISHNFQEFYRVRMKFCNLVQ